MLDLPIGLTVAAIVIVPVLFARSLPGMFPSETLAEDDSMSLDELDRRYKWWDLLDFVLLLLIPITGFLWYGILELLRQWHLRNLPMADYTLAAKSVFLVPAAILLGILSAYLVIPFLYRLFLGARYKEYLIYKAKKFKVLTSMRTARDPDAPPEAEVAPIVPQPVRTSNRPDPTMMSGTIHALQTTGKASPAKTPMGIPLKSAIAKLGFVTIGFGVLLAVFIGLCLDWTAQFNEKSFAINPFWSFSDIHHEYAEIGTVALVSNFKPPQDKHLKLVLRNGAEWGSDFLIPVEATATEAALAAFVAAHAHTPVNNGLPAQPAAPEAR